MKGKPVILAFYPADWSPVCGDQMALYNQILPEFQKYKAQMLGISVDGVWCHQAFEKDRNLHFPLLADFEPKGAVAKKYGVYRGEDGITERALFVIDGDGIIRWSYVSPVGINPGADGILSALDDYQERRSKMSSLATPVDVSRDHVQGPADAPITLVEYGDYECSYCGEAYSIVKKVQAAMGDRLRFVFRNFPLTEMHPHAAHAAEAAESADAQGRFWEMHDALYEHQDALGDHDLVWARERHRHRRQRGSPRDSVQSVRRAHSGRFYVRRPQRRQWNALVLHQRRPLRRRMG